MALHRSAGCWLAAALLLLLEAAAVGADIHCDCSIGGATYNLVDIQCGQQTLVDRNELCRTGRHGAVEEGYNVLERNESGTYESLYRLYRTARNWDDSIAACRRDGGLLAVPDSQEEFTLLGNLLKAEGNNRTFTAALGLVKSAGQNEDYYTFTGKLIGGFLYHNFGAGAPYNVNARQCMTLNWTPRGWAYVNRHDCDEPIAYLCERPLRPPVPAAYTFVPGLGFYMVSSSFLAYAEAEKECLKNGGHIVVVDTQKEADALMQAFDKFPGVDRIYVGLDDRRQAGQFITVHGGKLSWLEFQNWAPGTLESRSADAHCVSLTSAGSYELVLCDLPLPTVCEWPLY